MKLSKLLAVVVALLGCPGEMKTEHPFVGHVGEVPWYLDFLSCTTCTAGYQALEQIVDMYFPMTSNHIWMQTKVFKGAMHFFCFWFYDGPTCMRYLQTYHDLVYIYLFEGVLSQDFVCTIVAHMCKTFTYTRETVQLYYKRLVEIQKPPSLNSNDFADNYYLQNIRGKDTLIPYTVLHIDDLAIDLEYIAGADAKCRQFRCCHTNRRGEIDEDPKIRAGTFGTKDCDMPLNGSRALLTKLKEKVLEKYGEINIVVVTGVMTNQPGQLDTSVHIETVKAAYAMVQEVFSSSYIFPVLGTMDTYPTHYYNFQDVFYTTYKPSLSKLDQYIIQNGDFAYYTTENWSTNYPFKAEHLDVPSDEIGFDPIVNTFSDTYQGKNFWVTENVPYKSNSYQEFDLTTGDLIKEIEYPQALQNTMFFALNSLACYVQNAALYKTMNDPGNQLESLESMLITARSEGKTMIIAGGLHPGSPKCNRQWSHRYSALVDAFQDVVRLQIFGGNGKETFDIFRDLDSGNPVSIATTSAPFNAYSKDLSGRVLEVDLASNFPIKIETVVIPASQLDSEDGSGISARFEHAYPDDFDMLDLSPTEYSKLVERIQTSETDALKFIESTRFNDSNEDALDSCNQRCRVQTACSLNYSVNEFKLLCTGYYFDYTNTWLYYKGALQNPWYDKVPVEFDIPTPSE